MVGGLVGGVFWGAFMSVMTPHHHLTTSRRVTAAGEKGLVFGLTLIVCWAVLAWLDRTDSPGVVSSQTDPLAGLSREQRRAAGKLASGKLVIDTFDPAVFHAAIQLAVRSTQLRKIVPQEAAVAVPLVVALSMTSPFTWGGSLVLVGIMAAVVVYAAYTRRRSAQRFLAGILYQPDRQQPPQSDRATHPT